MAGYVGVLVSDPWLQSQFTQVELRALKSRFISMKQEGGRVTASDLAAGMANVKAFGELFSEKELGFMVGEHYPNAEEEIDFEGFLRLYLNLQSHASAKLGGSKNSSAFLKVSTTTLLHTVSESEKAAYVAHINSYLEDDPVMQRYLPIDPSANDIFEIVKDGVLLCKLINVAVPGTIDDRAINTKSKLNPWERNENHTLCLNSAKAIGCTVVNIGTQDLVEGRKVHPSTSETKLKICWLIFLRQLSTILIPGNFFDEGNDFVKGKLDESMLLLKQVCTCFLTDKSMAFAISNVQYLGMQLLKTR